MSIINSAYRLLSALALLSTFAPGCSTYVSSGGQTEVSPAPRALPGIGTAYVSTIDQREWLREEPLSAAPPNHSGPTIALAPDEVYQPVEGFGFTLTGGSAQHLADMSAPARAALLQELFGSGAGAVGFSYLRLSVGASDLDASPWSYDDLPTGQTDEALAKFTLSRDTLQLIPVLREILAIRPSLKLMGSPWSPPVWMKDNGDTRGGSLLPAMEPIYARYLAKYVEAMAARGITIDALTIQNEPLHPGNNPSLLMLSSQQARFIGQYLGPEFERRGLKTKLIAYDHNADRPDYPIEVLGDADANRYTHGSAFHLYGGEITALSEVHEAFPDKALYFTEQWVGAPGNFTEDFSWHVENLVIGATNNWARAVLEWNLTSNPALTPHTDRGGCDRCLGAVTIDGDVVRRNPAYYTIAQASKFVLPGSERIGSTVLPGLPNVAFRRPDGKLVLIVQNRTGRDAELNLTVRGRSSKLALEAEAVATVVFE